MSRTIEDWHEAVEQGVTIKATLHKAMDLIDAWPVRTEQDVVVELNECYEQIERCVKMINLAIGKCTHDYTLVSRIDQVTNE